MSRDPCALLLTPLRRSISTSTSEVDGTTAIKIETLFQPVGLWDVLRISSARTGIELTGTDPSIPWNSDNLCYRAAESMFRWAGVGGGVSISVQKGIPAGAGLGGGSADAAATLLGVNSLFGLGMSEGELFEIALSLGSDVPFFIRGRPSVGRGRGEVLEETEGLKNGWILLVKPSISISTDWAYRNIKIGLTRQKSGDTLGQLIEGLKRFPEAELLTWNSFTSSVIERFPEIGEIIAKLKREGAILSALSGSGSACFGIFTEESRAAEVSKAFIGKGLFTGIVRPVDRAVVLLQE
jgi:4-diphosphocytidyl-2-C-methyl-D-erythritol kinase